MFSKYQIAWLPPPTMNQKIGNNINLKRLNITALIFPYEINTNLGVRY